MTEHWKLNKTLVQQGSGEKSRLTKKTLMMKIIHVITMTINDDCGGDIFTYFFFFKTDG